jgi:hypothetical protein
VNVSERSEIMSAAAPTDRLCQFFLRGRCQRENCEFRHDLDRRKAMQDEAAKAAKATAGSTSPARPAAPLCMYFQRGACKLGDKCRLRHEPKPAAETRQPEPKKSGVDTDDERALGKDSDDDLAAAVHDSDDESLASGFTDAPNAGKKENANVASKVRRSFHRLYLLNRFYISFKSNSRFSCFIHF